MSSSKLRTRIATGALLTVPLAFLGATAPAYAETPRTVTFSLNAAKGSEAKGTATLSVQSDGDLKVHIKSTGLTPNMPHAQHIHGDISGERFFCPNASRDKDDDGFISVEEGLVDYGGIHVSLTTKGDTSPKSSLAVDRMPVADGDGNLSYSRTIKGEDLPEGTIDALSRLHIVEHGVDANGNDKYDLDGLGESTFAKSLGVDGIPEEASDVATCGEVMPSGGVETGGGTATSGIDQAGLVGIGSIAILGAGAAMVIRRRMVAQAK